MPEEFKHKVPVTEYDEDYAEAEAPGFLHRLDLACGNNKKKGLTGIDISKDSSADLFHDLNIYPWPFEDNSTYEINCSHFVEHVADLKKFMEECWRILVPLGTMTIFAPYFTHVMAMADFTHVRLISEITFKYFNQKWLNNNKLSHYKVNCDFDMTHIRYYFEPEWETRAENAKDWARMHYANTVRQIEVILKANK